ncbi:MAG: aromatic ring-hydroxylating dioxygenase subunit alpha [Pseudomonadota bacterium]
MTQQPDVDALGDVMTGIAHAKGLPNAAYTSAAHFEAEAQQVFARNWTAIAFAHDLAGPSHALPLEFMGQPLLLASDQTGEIRVFQNVCRHRGMILVDAPKHVPGALRCPYHSWCYDLTGKLRATPHVGGPGHNCHEAIDHNALGLIEIRSHIWRGVVFINLDGTAEPFEAANETLLDRWSDFHAPPLPAGDDAQFELDIATNWKLAVENYCESYHLPWVHPALNSYSRLEDHYNIEADGEFSGQGTLVYRQLKDDAGRTFADADGLHDTWDEAAEYIAVYPNLLLGVHRDHSFAIILQPRAPNRTTERVAIFYHQPEMLGADFADMRRENTALWKTVFEEDISVVEGMQRGRSASHFDGGRFSPVMDAPTHMFHRWVASQFLTDERD